MPIDVTCSACQTKFQVKDEYAGRKVRCSECKAVIELPELDEEDQGFPEDTNLHPAFQRDKFLLHQKHFSINTRYSVFDEDGKEIMHVVRPSHFFRQVFALLALVFTLIVAILAVVLALVVLHPSIGDAATAVIAIVSVVGVIIGSVFLWALLAPKRHITFYADEKKEEKLLEVLQNQKIAIRMATYTVLNETGQEIGRFRKDYLANLLRKRWDGFDEQGEQFITVREDSIVLSLLRRFLGTFYGLLRTNFVIHQVGENGKDGPLLGEFNRKFTLQDRYVLDCSHDRSRSLDRRMAIALGVLLDTGEKR